MSRSLSSSPRSREAAIKKQAQRPPPSKPSGRPTPGRSEAPPGQRTRSELLLLGLLGLLRLFRLLRFLSHSILSRVNGGTRHEACSAEGQPRNILRTKLNRFAARCPALSRHCHCVIHSCYAFAGDFCARIRLAATQPRAGLNASAQ